MDKISKPIFIVGIRRSGSTLWRRILEKNDRIMVYGEMQYLWPWEKDFNFFLKKNIGEFSDDEKIKKMVDLIFSNPPPNLRLFDLRLGFWEFLRENNNSELKEKITNRIIKSDRSIGSIFKAILEETTKNMGFERYAIKFPVYFNYIDKLLDWYPESRIVHITRDPRAIYVSKKNDPGGTARLKSKYPYFKYPIEKFMVFFVIYQYNWSAKIHGEFKRLKNYTLFHYEDLLYNPEKTIQGLCNFLDLVYDKEMLFPSRGRFSSVTGLQREGIEKKSGYHWKDNINYFEEKIITVFTKKSMKKMDYDPLIHPIFET